MVTGIDDEGASFLVVTDKAGAYPAVLKRLGAKMKQEDSHSHAISHINSLHSRLKDFMYGFKGVSPKYLQSYLPWFKWTESFKSGIIGQHNTRRLSACQRRVPHYLPHVSGHAYACVISR